jgi:hypothetical protein
MPDDRIAVARGTLPLDNPGVERFERHATGPSTEAW